MANKLKLQRTDFTHVPPSYWGRDHLSTFVYVETRAVDYKGVLDVRHLRRHSPEYPTRLAGGALLAEHDDLDCCDDLQAAGLLVARGTGLHPAFALTDMGWALAGTLRRFRAEGHQVASFDVEGWIASYHKEEHA